MAATKRKASDNTKNSQPNRSETFSLPAVTVDGRQIRFILMDQHRTFHIARDLFKADCQPLFLGSDVLAGIKQDTKNHHRVHARFALHGLATKLILTDVRIEGTPNCGTVYFYSILGMFQAVFEYHPLSVQRHCLENFRDIWLQVSREAPSLEENCHISPANLMPPVPDILDLHNTQLESCLPLEMIPELSMLEEDGHYSVNPFNSSGAKWVKSEADSSQVQNICSGIKSEYGGSDSQNSVSQRFVSDHAGELAFAGSSHLSSGGQSIIGDTHTTPDNEDRDRATESESSCGIHCDCTSHSSSYFLHSCSHSCKSSPAVSPVQAERDDEYHPPSKHLKTCSSCHTCSPFCSVINDTSGTGSCSLSDLVRRWLQCLQSSKKTVDHDCQRRQSSDFHTVSGKQSSESQSCDSFEAGHSCDVHSGSKCKPGVHNPIWRSCSSQHEVLTATTLPYLDADPSQLKFAELVIEFLQHSLQLVTPSTDLPVVSQLLSLIVSSLGGSDCEGTVSDEWSCLSPGKSAALTTFSRWLGEEFHRLEPSISRRVMAFKEAHIENICNLPSAEEVVRELFPPCMVELARTWTGLQELQSTDTLYMDHSYEHGGKVKVRSRTENRNLFPIIQLVLELANNTLVSGVAHVVYCQLRHVT